MRLLASQKIPAGKTNVRIKSYPSKNVIQICNQSIFTLYPDAPKPKETQAGESKKTKREKQPSGNDTPPLATRIAKDPKRALEESKKRAASQVRDIALCNQFEYFITWTLDGTLIDRYDAAAVYAKVRNVLSNASRRHGFQYVLVPEYHSRKKHETTPAIHMHGLCKLGTLPIERSTTKSGRKRVDNHGRPVYNMPSWIWGFSSCVPLDDQYERTVSYITKYITKSDKKIFGKWFLSSRNLVKRPEIIPIEPVVYDDYRDPDKLERGIQFESNLYGPVYLLSEEFPKKKEENDNENV